MCTFKPIDYYQKKTFLHFYENIMYIVQLSYLAIILLVVDLAYNYWLHDNTFYSSLLAFLNI